RRAVLDLQRELIRSRVAAAHSQAGMLALDHSTDLVERVRERGGREHDQRGLGLGRGLGWRQERRHRQEQTQPTPHESILCLPIMTSVDLNKARTSWPTAKPRRSAEERVMIETSS